MKDKKIFREIEDQKALVLEGTTERARELWSNLLQLHPADLADFISSIEPEDCKRFFTKFPAEIQLELFAELSDGMKLSLLNALDEPGRVELLHSLPINELTDLFDSFSDEELKRYLSLLNKKSREQVLSLRKFEPDSAGGIMDTEVLAFSKEYTVEKSIKLIQRTSPNKDIHRHVFVTDMDNTLIGYVNLEDLVLHKPEEKLVSFIHKIELSAKTSEDQEAVARKMVHYGLMTIPVVDDQNHFLGVISSDTLVDVLIEEASENVQKMSATPPLRYPYFEAPFSQLFGRRAYVLLALFAAEMLSGNILRAYDREGVLTVILHSFIPIITSAGGNIGSQSSAVVIQGLATGEFDFSNMGRLLKREFMVAFASALLLGVVAFGRVYSISGTTSECLAVSSALAIILFASAMFGTSIPFLLRKLDLDPAISAGPFLATIMDIFGIFIFCRLSSILLR